MLATIVSAVHHVLPKMKSLEAYYMGNALILIERIVGYRFLQFNCMIILHVAITTLRFSLLGINEATMPVIVIGLEIMTIVLSFKTERGERGSFHEMYKAKKDALKFKHLLTEYLPNQMVIFETKYCEPKYINKAFKRAFRCDNVSNAVSSLNKLVIEPETIKKHRGLFSGFGLNSTEITQPVHLPEFLASINNNINLLKECGTINFIVLEEESRMESFEIMENKIKDEDKEKGKDKGSRDTMFIDTVDPLPKRRHPSNSKIPKISPRSSCNKQRTSVEFNIVKRDGSKGKEDNESFLGDNKLGSRSNLSETIMEEGKRRVYKMKLFLLVWDDVEAVALVLDDITKQKTISELRIADKNKDLVIAMVSHELRTPLNGMLGLIDIAKNKLKQHDLLPYLNACRNNGVLLLSLVNSILDLSQIKNNKLTLIFAKIDLKEVLNEIKSLFNYFCVLKGIYLEIDIQHDVHRTISTDRNRLSQIIINLLGNAFKFTIKGGITIKVEVANQDPYRVKFLISDTGIGIKREDQDKLFKLFGRLEHEDKKINTNGVGLGLTISNTLALLLNPSEEKGIQLFSELDKGSTFFFTVQEKVAEVQNEKDLSEMSLENISTTSINEDKDHSVVRKMSVYTVNAIDNFMKSVNTLNNLEQNQDPFSKTGKKSGNKDPDPCTSLSMISEDAVLLKYPPKKRECSLEIIEDLGSPLELARDDDDDIGQQSQDQGRLSRRIDNVQKPWSLLVDDNPFNLMVASHIMKDRGYRIKTAINGKDAIDKATEHENAGDSFRVILMDCQMPVMDGYESSRMLRKMMNGKEIKECPILALTANDRDEEHEKRAAEVGMSGSISKPLQIEELEDVLRKLQKKSSDAKRKLRQL